MKRALFDPLACLVLAGLLAGSPVRPIHADSFQLGEAGDFASFENREGGDSSSTAGFWKGCPSHSAPVHAYRLCEQGGSAIDTLAFRRLHDRLQAGVDEIEELCEIDAAVIQAQHSCASAAEVTSARLISALMGLLGRNWQHRGVLDRADELYRRAYELENKLESRGQGALAAINILQNWALLKLERGEPQHAKELAERATALARNDYETGSRPARSFVNALEFQARVLEKLDLPSEAQTTRQLAAAVSTLYDSSQESWLFDYISPKLWPLLEEVTEEIHSRIPDVEVLSPLRNPGDNRFGASVRFSRDLDAQTPAKYVAIVVNCGISDDPSPALSLAERWTRRTCRSQITEGEGENGRILKEGPSSEFELVDDDGVRKQLDRWVAATTTFILQNTDLVIQQLDSAN